MSNPGNAHAASMRTACDPLCLAGRFHGVAGGKICVCRMMAGIGEAIKAVAHAGGETVKVLNHETLNPEIKFKQETMKPGKSRCVIQKPESQAQKFPGLMVSCLKSWVVGLGRSLVGKCPCQEPCH